MKLSMMSYTVSRQKEHFDLAKMLDLTVELKMDGIDFVTLHDTPAAELRKMCDDRGIRVVCHTFLAHELTSPDPETRRKCLDLCRAGFEAAQILGTRIVMIPTAGVKNRTREESHADWIRGLAEAAPLATAAGVTLTAENFPGPTSPFVTAADLRDGMEKIPGLKVTYDSGNAATGEEPGGSFRRVAPQTIHAHFKDWEISAGEREGFCKMLDGKHYKPALIGEGGIDHRAVLTAMKECGYQGCINIEYEGNTYDPYEANRRAADYLRSLAAEIGY